MAHKENLVCKFRKLERKQLKWFTMGNFTEKEVKLEMLVNKEKVGRSIYWWGWWGKTTGEMGETEQACWSQKWFMNYWIKNTRVGNEKRELLHFSTYSHPVTHQLHGIGLTPYCFWPFSYSVQRHKLVIVLQKWAG